MTNMRGLCVGGVGLWEMVTAWCAPGGPRPAACDPAREARLDLYQGHLTYADELNKLIRGNRFGVDDVGG